MIEGFILIPNADDAVKEMLENYAGADSDQIQIVYCREKKDLQEYLSSDVGCIGLYSEEYVKLLCKTSERNDIIVRDRRHGDGIKGTQSKAPKIFDSVNTIIKLREGEVFEEVFPEIKILLGQKHEFKQLKPGPFDFIYDRNRM